MQHQTIDTSKTYTLDEYIKIEPLGDEKHEYYDGKLITMPGESLLHNEIVLTITILLHKLLKAYNYKIYVEDVKVSIEGENKYVYPDVTVIKEQPVKELPYKDYIIYQPLLIVEVLSDSTRKHDLTDKFILYQKISSLQYYLTVEPEKHLIHLFEKTGENDWIAKTFTELNEVISLSLFDVQFALSDIYKS